MDGDKLRQLDVGGGFSKDSEFVVECLHGEEKEFHLCETDTEIDNVWRDGGAMRVSLELGRLRVYIRASNVGMFVPTAVRVEDVVGGGGVKTVARYPVLQYEEVREDSELVLYALSL